MHYQNEPGHGHHGEHGGESGGMHHGGHCAMHHGGMHHIGGGMMGHHMGMGMGMGFRRFISRDEMLPQLEEYLKQLQAEAKAVEERIVELKKD